MVARARFRFAAVAALALAAAPEGFAAETRWSEGVGFKNRNPVVAWTAPGSGSERGFAVWENERLGLLGRALDAAGKPTGAVVTLRTNGDLPPVPGEAEVLIHREPVVVLDRAGRAVVAWTQEVVRIRTDYFFEDRVVLQRDVFAQVFDSAGQAIGDSFRVHPKAIGFQARPSIGLVANGNTDLALIAWEGDANDNATPGVFARLFQTTSRKPVAGEFTVAGGDARRPAVASLGGSALIGWEANGDNGKRAVFARSLNGPSRVLGSVKQIAATSPFNQGQLALAANGQNGYLAAWVLSRTTTRTRLYARPLGTDGAPSGAQGPVTDGTARAESAPALAARGGAVALVWYRWGTSLVEGVLGARLTSAGKLAASEEWLNERPPSAGIYRPTVTITPDGSTIGAWQAPDTSSQWSIRSAELEE